MAAQHLSRDLVRPSSGLKNWLKRRRSAQVNFGDKKLWTCSLPVCIKFPEKCHPVDVSAKYIEASGRSRPGVWGGWAVKLGGGKNVFTCLNTKGCLRQSLCVTQKRLSFVGQKVAIFVCRTMLFFRE